VHLKEDIKEAVKGYGSSDMAVTLNELGILNSVDYQEIVSLQSLSNAQLASVLSEMLVEVLKNDSAAVKFKHFLMGNKSLKYLRFLVVGAG